MTTCYLGLGSNMGDRKKNIFSVCALLQTNVHIFSIKCSSLYETTPVSTILQQNFINAVCRVTTSLSANDLHTLTRSIEKVIGKVPKSKEAPRIIDIDILFYGNQQIREKDLQIPHPEWKNRLFVLQPLAELTKEIDLPCEEKAFSVVDYLTNFTNPHKESVSLIL